MDKVLYGSWVCKDKECREHKELKVAEEFFREVENFKIIKPSHLQLNMFKLYKERK